MHAPTHAVFNDNIDVCVCVCVCVVCRRGQTHFSLVVSTQFQIRLFFTATLLLEKTFVSFSKNKRTQSVD